MKDVKINPDHLEFLAPPRTLSETLASVEKVLPGKSEMVLLAMAVSISHLVDRQIPLWLMFVGVPSSAKTEVVRMFCYNPYVKFIDSLTDNAFVSGSLSPNGKEPNDLLPLLDGKCFICKDLTTTLSQREESVRKILGDLTSIYDDTFSKHSPFRGTVEYHSFFPIIACVTPQALNKHYRYMNQIGPRFLYYKVQPLTEEELGQGFGVVWSTTQNKTDLDEARKNVSAYSWQIAVQVGADGSNLAEESSEIQSALNCLARFIAKARGTVLTRATTFRNESGDEVTHNEIVEIQIEEPYRALIQLRTLARSLAVIKGKNTVEFEELALVRKVALSSMPADRAQILSVVASEQREWSAKDVASRLGYAHKTALRQLDELAILGILSKREQGTGLANLYEVVGNFVSIVYPNVELMSHPATETQTPQSGDLAELVDEVFNQ